MKSGDRKLSNIVFLTMLQEGEKLVSRGFPREVNRFSGRETRVPCPGIKQFGFIVRDMKVSTRVLPMKIKCSARWLNVLMEFHDSGETKA